MPCVFGQPAFLWLDLPTLPHVHRAANAVFLPSCLALAAVPNTASPPKRRCHMLDLSRGTPPLFHLGTITMLSQTLFQGMLVSQASVNIGLQNTAITDAGLANTAATITGLATYATELTNATISDDRGQTRCLHVP